jgi:hypothetical protein
MSVKTFLRVREEPGAGRVVGADGGANQFDEIASIYLLKLES